MKASVAELNGDPRGPYRRIVLVADVRAAADGSGSCRPVMLSCGHVRELNAQFSYLVGEWAHCFACRLEGEAAR
jgi:hypothetical protein